MEKIHLKYPDLKKELEEFGHEIFESLRLEKLLDELQEKTDDEAALKKCVFELLEVLGVIDEKTKKIKPEIASGEENFMPHLLKSLSSVMALFMKANGPKFMRGNSEEEIKQKFGFVANIMPIIKKHAGK